MKRALLALTAAMMLLASQTGCQLTQSAACGRCNGGCPNCGNGYVYGSRDAPGFFDMVHAKKAARRAAAGPQTPTYSYPYYTTRGPRDFLADNPPSIGR